MKTFICVVCGNEFEAKRKAKTCSKACRTAKWRAENPESKLSVTSDTVTDNSQSEMAALKAEIASLRRVIERQTTTIELLALNQVANPKAEMSQKELPIGPKPIDSSEIVLEVKASEDKQKTNPNANFLASMAAFG